MLLLCISEVLPLVSGESVLKERFRAVEILSKVFCELIEKSCEIDATFADYREGGAALVFSHKRPGVGVPIIWLDSMLEEAVNNIDDVLGDLDGLLAQSPMTPQKELEQEPPDMMSIAEASIYARTTERTIRSWLKTKDGDKPMLAGVIWNGKIPRIPRTSLDPWRKPAKKEPIKKPVKKNSKGKITG